VPTSFEHLLDPSAYEDDPPVRVEGDGRELWVSERIWNRLWHVGAAYHLHLIPLLDGRTEPVSLNAVQAEDLGEELAFIETVSTDRVLLATVEQVSNLARQAARSGKEQAFTVEGS
jgi:hypothetical protein